MQAQTVTIQEGLQQGAAQTQPCAVSPKHGLPLSKTITVMGELFDFASDYHLPSNERVVDEAVRALAARRQSDVFICVGDVFDASNGEDRSADISSFLTKLSRAYPLVLYTPGNHCLRSRDNPWATFQVPDNVLIPQADTPLVCNTERNKIVLANLFYDLRFIKPASIGVSESKLLDFYRMETIDGKNLLGGEVELFKSMADRTASLLTPEVTMLVTHTLPHPVGVTFKVSKLTEEHKEIERLTGARFICAPEDDEREALRRNTTSEHFRMYWNLKSLIMGSDVVNHAAANPRNGLICLYGHNHRSDDFNVQVRNGATVGLRSHQPYGGGNPTAWNSIVPPS